MPGRLFTTIFALGIFLGFPADRASAEDCLGCHGDPARSDIGKQHVDRTAYESGAHGGLDCADCHEAADAKGYEVVPHRLSEEPPPTCMECHEEDFEGYHDEYEKSVHARKLETFACTRCHDPHALPKERESLARAERVELANRACLRCHRDSVFRVVARHDGKRPSHAHDWLPKLDKHARMRCIVCHTPVENDLDHDIQPKEQATRDCTACHAEDAPLVEKYVGVDDRKGWVTNPLVFQEAYVPGATKNRLIDTIIVVLAALAVVGALGHGLLRIVSASGRQEAPYRVEKIYLYSTIDRIGHWTNAFLVIVLAITGFRLHFGGRESILLSFETAFNVHNLLGALLVVVGLLFFGWNLVSGGAKQYLSKPLDGARGLSRQVRYYLYGIFKGEPHPYHATPEWRFNPLQQVTYMGVMYVVFPVLLITGVVLLFPTVLPERIGGRPATWWFATAHFLSAAAILLFLLGHLYLATTGDRVSYLFRAMTSGWHRHHVPKASDAAPSGDEGNEGDETTG